MKKLLVIALIALCLCIATAQAWTIVSDKYSGTITLYGDGSGVANVDGHNPVQFTWNQVDGNNYEAHYWFYTVPFTYNPENNTITSPSTSAYLVP